ncbi:hypothetical protein ACRAWF_27920 [Streptomyces sp. L7]
MPLPTKGGAAPFERAPRLRIAGRTSRANGAAVPSSTGLRRDRVLDLSDWRARTTCLERELRGRPQRSRYPDRVGQPWIGCSYR